MKILEKDSAYSLIRDFYLSDGDELVLSLLYLPMIHLDAFGLYQALICQSYQSQIYGSFSHEDLLKDLGKNETEFLGARTVLEAIGLLETYRKEERAENGSLRILYIYRLLPPASPKKFFSDTLLKVNLSSAVGQKRYFRLKSFFQAKDVERIEEAGYIDISSKFKDVFCPDVSKDDPSLFENDALLPDKNYKSQASFDVGRLKDRLQELSYYEKGIEANLEEIVSYCVLYGIAEKDAADLILANTDALDGNRFYVEEFKKACRNFHHFQRKETKEEKETYGTSEDAKYLNIVSSLSPQKFLAIRLNAAPNSAMLKEVERLQKEFGFSNGVINVLLDYCLRKTGNEFNVRFIEPVAYTLSGNHVSSPSEAMTMLASRDYEKKRSMGKKKRKAKEETIEESSSDKEEKDDGKKDEDLKSLSEELRL